MQKTVLILPPGGMLSVLLSGELEALGIHSHQFDEVLACSSSIVSAVYWMTQQQELVLPIWQEISHPKFFSLLRWPRPPAKMDEVVDTVCRDLNINTLFGLPTQLRITVYCPKHNRTECHLATPQTFDNLFRASVALPLITRKVCIDGTRYTDACTAEIFPLEHIQSYSKQTKFVFLFNQPTWATIDTLHWFKRLAAFPLNLKTRHAIQRRDQVFRDTLAFIATLNQRAYVIAPEQKNPMSRFTRNQAEVIAGYRMGQALGKQHAHQINTFLSD